MDDLYGHVCPECGGLYNAVDYPVTFDPEVLAKGLREIYDGLDVKNVIERFIFDETLRLFNEAAAKGMAESEYAVVASDEFIRQIRTNNAVFSAFRVHRMQNDVARQLIDGDGKLKSFDKWMQDIKGITNHYVRNWLQSEYSTAVIRAHQAVDWKHFETEADVLPNLRWMPTTSPNQDPLHRQYWEKRLTLPVGHPFWNEHHPGDRWNCKCTLMQTDEPANDELVRDLYPVPAQPGLENNPAKDGKIFSDTHPYFTQAYQGAEKAVKASVTRQQLGESIRQVQYNYPVGKTIRLGKLSDNVVKFIENKGITLQSKDLYVSDHRIAHALRDSKQGLGKAVLPEQLADALSDLGKLDLYWDDLQKGLWFIKGNGNQTEKYIFRINDKIKINGKKQVVNEFITSGIIDASNINMVEEIK